ncbi:MAG: RagB/SusD family nutrient uptake outer membrane protein [Dysgonamonadaceae bacterium]|jgi:hypothetical protein|nr:RagB/SusD family nutrient uptake outer membrane protein [Dysgonamonadaceae bacterium]
MKYKSLYRLLLTVSVVIAFHGCSDFLDTKIDTNFTPDAVETNRGTLWSFGNAMYSSVQSGFTSLDGNLFAAASDEAQQTPESGYTYYFNRGIISPDNVGSATNGIYNACYEGIRAANFFLDYAKDGEKLLALNRDTVKDFINFERDLRNLNWFRAEAHVARAYYYMELLKRFGGTPIVETTMDKDADPGRIPRASYNEVVEYIVKEIDTYKDGLQTNWKTHPDNVSKSDGRFELKSALAIKARTLLYAASPLNNPNNDKSKWERAAKAAHDVIVAMNYTMSTGRNYATYFQGNNASSNAESIFLVRVGNANTLETNNYPIATPGGHSGVTPTEDLVSAYEYIGAVDPANPYNNRDPRLAATVVTNGSRWNNRTIDQAPGGTDDMHLANTSKTGYYLKKFLVDNLNLVQGAQNYDVWIVFRYAEILLMYAEAMNQAYGPDTQPEGFTRTARQALTEVRRSASASLPAVTTTNPAEFLAAVKHERQVELAFEDHRYWDLLRWKDAETVLNRPVRGLEITKDVSGNFVYKTVNVAERTFHTKNYHLPFSRSEVINSNGNITQNEGY